MLSSEILKKVRKIQFKANRLLNAPFAGQYASVFKGMGIEFDEVREYVPGDEIRTIDWNVTARAGSPYVKRYVEERELTLMLVVDLSGSQYFGAAGPLKSEIAAEISAVPGLSGHQPQRPGRPPALQRPPGVVPAAAERAAPCLAG